MTYTNEELGALVERLNHLGADSIGDYGIPICNEAAAAIRQLMAERDELLGPNPVAEMLRKELAALRKKIEKAKPVAWMTHESKFRLKQGGNCKGAVPVHQNNSVTAKIPLYTLEGIKE